MSRSDFWSIAVTLVVAGVAYFVGGQKTAYGCIAVGVLTILYLLFTHKKSEPTSVSVTTSPQMTANPQVVASPNVSQNVYVVHPSEKREQPLPARPKPKPQHNLQFQSCKMACIDYSLGQYGGMAGFHFAEDQSKSNAAVVCIKNKSRDREVAEMHDVRAALTFRDDKGQEIGGGIAQACWVDRGLGNASFDLEETRCVILVVLQRDAKGKVVDVSAPYIKQHTTDFGVASTVERYDLNEILSTVDLVLLSGNSRVMEPMTFEFVGENGRPAIRLRP